MTIYRPYKIRSFQVRCRLTVLLFSTFLISAFLIKPDAVYACTAPIGGLDPFIIKNHVDASEAVFLGKVIKQYEYPPTQPPATASQFFYLYYVEIEVSNYFKGSGKDTVTMARFGTSALCLRDVSVNNSYIFFGNPNNSYNEITFNATYLLTQQATAPPTQENIQMVLDAVNPQPTFEIYFPIIAKNNELVSQHKSAESGKIDTLFKSRSSFFNLFALISD